jgi:selenocysteine lyase/cysteine desulfurase
MDDLGDRLISAIGPRTKVLHICHITNLTGQIFPVKKICDAARAKGVKTVVDGAHAFAHFPYKAADLGCDFYGTSLHKWLLAPIGPAPHVRREASSRWTPTAPRAPKDIASSGDRDPAANHNRAEALSFHEGMGIERKSARLRYLRNRWATRLQKTGRFTLHTPMDPAQSCAIGTVQVVSVPTGKAVQTLWDKWRIIATPIVHAEYEGIRVTPNVYTTLEEIDTFAEAMESL